MIVAFRPAHTGRVGVTVAESSSSSFVLLLPGVESGSGWSAAVISAAFVTWARLPPMCLTVSTSIAFAPLLTVPTVQTPVVAL